jgi:hypothetical protein
MGWASGSSILDTIAYAVLPLISPEERDDVATKLIDVFENEDCDTVYECRNPDIRAAYVRMYPEEEGNL